MSIRHALVAALLVAPLTLTSLPVQAQQAPAAADDGVELRDGGVLRGKILEVIPNDSVTIESAASGERKTFPWSSIASYDRGGSRIDVVPRVIEAPPPMPATPPPPRQDDGAGGFGVPILHIESSREVSDLQLYKITSQIVAVGSAGSMSGYTYRSVCSAPCDRPVDGSQGEGFYFGGDGVTGSHKFSLSSYSGKLTAQVKPGRKGLRIGGFVLAATGPSLILGGVLWIVLQGITRTSIDENGDLVSSKGSANHTGGAVLIGLGSAMLVGGIVMALLGRTKFKLVPSGGLGLLRPLKF